MSLRFSTGSGHVSRGVEPLAEGLTGLFAGDAGYLLKQEVFARLMTDEQGLLLRKRSIIETAWGVLKERFGLVFHLARSITGLFRHYCYSLLSKMLQPVLYSSSLKLPDLSIDLLYQ